MKSRNLETVTCKPRLSKRVKKIICMGLACMMMVVGVLSSSVGVYEAGSYDYADWNVFATSPGSTSTIYDTVYLYVTTQEEYRWGLTEFQTPSGYGVVSITGINNKITMKSGNNKLTVIDDKNFTISDISVTTAQPYAAFRITLDFDSYVTSYSGYVDIP